MKSGKFLKSSVFYKPALAAVLLGLSRLPLHLGFLVFFGLIPLFSFFEENRKNKDLVKAAIIFSSLYTVICMHWISLATTPGFLGMFIVIGLYFSILFYLIGNIWKALPKVKYIAFLCFWLSFEFLQNFGEFRFPWFNIGYSLSDYLPFIQIAEIGGIYLLSALIILVNILISELKNKFKINFIFLVVIVLLWAGFGFVRLRTIKLEKTSTNISIVQVSIPQDLKWEKAYLDTTLQLYQKYTELASENNSSLVIWPESATPFYLLRQPKYKDFVLNLARENNTDIFTGFPHYKFAGSNHPQRYKFYNAASLFDKNGKIHPPYYKNVLVPFGERIPLLYLFPFLWDIHLGQANWEYGEKLEYYDVDGYKYSPMICFEIAFEVLTTKMAKHNADFIVNITNDAWFKRSAGTYQHAVMLKFRAVETRKQIYRAANTGYSLVVSPTGEFLKKTKLFEKAVINEDLLIYKNNSFFTKYFSWFPIVFVIVALIIFVFFILRVWKKQ